jgi:hypothetical protein
LLDIPKFSYKCGIWLHILKYSYKLWNLARRPQMLVEAEEFCSTSQNSRTSCGIWLEYSPPPPPQLPNRVWGLATPYPVGAGGCSSLGVNCPGHEGDRLPSSSAKFKGDGAIYMETSGQLHAPVALPPGNHSIRSWVGPRAGLEAVDEWDSNPAQQSALPYRLSYPDSNAF